MENDLPPETNPPLKESLLSLRNKIKAVFLVICILGGVSSWYFFYFIKTPEYALNQVRQAVEKHDLVKFNKYVDLNTLLAQGYDDLIVVMLETDRTLTPEIKKVISGFSKIFKFPVVSSFKEGIFKLVETGTWKTQSTEDSALQGLDTNQLIKKTSFSSSAVKGIAYTKKDGKTAVVGLTIAEKELQQDFILDLKLRELDDGKWQIVKIANFKDYLLKIEQAKSEQIKQYLEESQSVLDDYDPSVKKINTVLEKHLSTANLADPDENSALKQLIETQLLPQLRNKVDGLAKITVPATVQPLHELRLTSCESDVQYAQKMLEWLEHKDPQTLKAANQLLRHAQEIAGQVQALTADTKAQQR